MPPSYRPSSSTNLCHPAKLPGRVRSKSPMHKSSGLCCAPEGGQLATPPSILRSGRESPLVLGRTEGATLERTSRSAPARLGSLTRTLRLRMSQEALAPSAYLRSVEPWSRARALRDVLRQELFDSAVVAPSCKRNIPRFRKRVIVRGTGALCHCVAESSQHTPRTLGLAQLCYLRASSASPAPAGQPVGLTA